MKVRKATGRRVEGGSKIGSMDVFVGRWLGFVVRKGCAGVPNPGDDDGIGSDSVGKWVFVGPPADRGVLSILV